MTTLTRAVAAEFSPVNPSPPGVIDGSMTTAQGLDVTAPVRRARDTIDPGELPGYRALATTLTRELLADPATVLIDTETTTLYGQIIEIGVLSTDGQVLFDSLVRPTESIPAEATAVHGLREDDLRDAPLLDEVAGALRLVLSERRVVAYNCHYDRTVLTAEEQRIGRRLHTATGWDCAMDLYAAWNGELVGEGTRFRNKRLPGAGHRALDDCRSMLSVLQLMAGVA